MFFFAKTNKPFAKFKQISIFFFLKVHLLGPKKYNFVSPTIYVEK